MQPEETELCKRVARGPSVATSQEQPEEKLTVPARTHYRGADRVKNHGICAVFPPFRPFEEGITDTIWSSAAKRTHLTILFTSEVMRDSGEIKSFIGIISHEPPAG